MRLVNAMAIFCEHIREEADGQFTLIGVLPDNLSVNELPGSLKLDIFVRINLDPNDLPSEVSVKIVLPGGSEIAESKVAEQVIEDGGNEALLSRVPLFGLLSRIYFPKLLVSEAGQIQAIATIDGEQVMCGSLNILDASEADND